MAAEGMYQKDILNMLFPDDNTTCLPPMNPTLSYLCHSGSLVELGATRR